MILLILTIILFILGIIFAITYITSIKYDYLSYLGAVIAIFAGIFLAVEIGMICLKPLDYNKFKVEYETVKQMGTYSEDIRDTNYTMKLIEINTQINYERFYIDSPWIGVFRNKKIAELELLEK